MRAELSECAEDERLSNGASGCVGARAVTTRASQCNKVGAKPRAPLQVLAVLTVRSPLPPSSNHGE